MIIDKIHITYSATTKQLQGFTRSSTGDATKQTIP